MENNKDNTLVVVGEYSFDWEAHIAEGLLQENGIECVISNEIFSSVYPIGFNSIGGISVSVRSADAEAARAILEDINMGE